jgi:hypothetical protein
VGGGGPGALEALAAAAERVAREDRRTAEVELAFSLLRSLPALGIFVARGCLARCHPLDAETLCEVIEEARAELGLAPGDPAWDLYAQLDEDDEPEPERGDEDDGSAELRGALRATSARVDELARQLAATREELDAARAGATASAPPPEPRAADAPDPARLRALKARVDRLEGLVREGHAERGDLRRQLAAARQGAKEPSPATAATRATVDDEGFGEALPGAARGVTVPRFARRAEDALASAPPAVAAEALRTVGSLAAGDAAAWCRVKQAHDMPFPLLMARVGIHHRLLFRVEAQAMEVMDLVTRESLMTTLKRIRSGRGA